MITLKERIDLNKELGYSNFEVSKELKVYSNLDHSRDPIGACEIGLKEESHIAIGGRILERKGNLITGLKLTEVSIICKKTNR